eukprot:542623-Pelagomonas_calceolata.AAC.4
MQERVSRDDEERRNNGAVQKKQSNTYTRGAQLSTQTSDCTQFELPGKATGVAVGNMLSARNGSTEKTKGGLRGHGC